MTLLNLCQMVDLPKISDRRGNLTFIEGQTHVPFDIERVYYLYDVPGGEARGGHAHKALSQILIAASGSFDVTLDDGLRSQKFSLNSASRGLIIVPMIWRELSNFSSGAVCLVCASRKYDEADYFRDYSEFRSSVVVA